MLLSIISYVKPLFSRYSYSITASKYWVNLYFRRTKNREWFKITLEQIDDHVVIDYITEAFSESRSCYNRKYAIDVLTHYIKASLKLYL